MTERPLVSVVMAVRDMEATIGAQLAALAGQDYTSPWELVVADNGSRDGTVAVVERWRARLPLRLIDASGPANPAYPRNVGVSVARGALLLFCDADDEVRHDWMRLMVGALEHSPMVTGVLDHTRLNPPSTAAAFPRWPTFEPGYLYLPSGAGGNLGIRRSVFEELGGFPGHRGEDTALSWLAQLAGHRLVLEPAAVVDRRLKAHSRWGVFRMSVRQGVAFAELYATFRDRGMTRSPLRELVYDYVTIPIHLVTGRSYLSARQAGWRLGRLGGSIRARVFFP